jgi:hypothetical protein
VVTVSSSASTLRVAWTLAVLISAVACV